MYLQAHGLGIPYGFATSMMDGTFVALVRSSVLEASSDSQELDGTVARISSDGSQVSWDKDMSHDINFDRSKRYGLSPVYPQ